MSELIQERSVREIQLERCRDLVEKRKENIKKAIPLFFSSLDVLCSSSDITEAMKIASRRLPEGYDDHLFIFKGKVVDYTPSTTWVDDSEEEKYMVFYIKSPEEHEEDIAQASRYC